MTDASELVVEGIEKVLTNYNRPAKMEGEWLSAKFTYTLAGNEDRLRFVLSAPGVAARVGAVDIRRITINYTRAPLSFSDWMDLVKREVLNAYRRL